MRVEMLWIPAFAGMTEETDGLDKSSPYIYIDRRDACPTVLSCFLYLITGQPGNWITNILSAILDLKFEIILFYFKIILYNCLSVINFIVRGY